MGTKLECWAFIGEVKDKGIHQYISNYGTEGWSTRDDSVLSQ